MTLSQSMNSCIPPSSSSSDSELNNALPVLLDSEKDSGQENTVESAPYIFDPLFPLNPLPQTTDLLPQSSNPPHVLSQEERRSQSASMWSVDTLPPTSIAHGTVSNSMPVEDSSTTLSLSTNSCLVPSLTYSSDPEVNDVLRGFIDDENHCGEESREVSDCMDPHILDLLLQIPLIPLPQTTNIESAYKEQGVDTFQPISFTAHSQPSSSEKVVSEMEPVFDLFSPIPVPQVTNLPAQKSSQSASKEEGVEPISSTAHSQSFDLSGSCTTQMVVSAMEPVFDLFSLIPLPQVTNPPPQESVQSASESKEQRVDTFQPFSSTEHSHPSSLDRLYNTDKEVSEMEPIFDLFSLIPLFQPTNLPPQESSQSASKDQDVSSAAHSHPFSLADLCTTEKEVSEMEPVVDLFSLIPLPEITDVLPQESSQSASEQEVDTFQTIISTAPPHHLPVDQALVQGEMGTLCSHSSLHKDVSVNTHANPDPPPPSLAESIQATSGEQVMTNSISSASPCTETTSQTEAESNIEVEDCTSGKGKPKKALSVMQLKRQRMLNKVSALQYRHRKKERMSDLDVRKEQLEAENTRLKEQVSVLTTEIAKLKRLSKTQKTKFCPFFFHSTCNKIK